MIENSLAAIAIISALLFGSVEPWSLAIVGLLTSLSFIYFILKYEDSYAGALPSVKGIRLAAALMLIYPILQLVPFPAALLGLVHPGFKEVVTLSPDLPTAFHSISIYRFATEMELARLTIYLMVFFAAAFGLSSRQNSARLLKVIAVFGFVLAVFSIIQLATWNGKIYWFRELTHGGSPFGPFVNRDHFAGFIGMILPLSLGLALRSRQTEKKIMYAFFSVIMGVALFFSLSRGGVTSFFAGMAVFLFVLFNKTSTKRLIPVFFFLMILFSYLLYLGIDPLFERFMHTEVAKEERLVVWQGTWAAIKDFPLFGGGLGAYQYIFKAYKPAGISYYYDHAHNDYLEFFFETGICGALIAGFFFFSVLRAIFNLEWIEKDVYLKAGLLASITTLAVHSLFDFNLHIPSNAILFFLILGLAVSYCRNTDLPERKRA